MRPLLTLAERVVFIVCSLAVGVALFAWYQIWRLHVAH